MKCNKYAATHTSAHTSVHLCRTFLLHSFQQSQSLNDHCTQLATTFPPTYTELKNILGMLQPLVEGLDDCLLSMKDFDQRIHCCQQYEATVHAYSNKAQTCNNFDHALHINNPCSHTNQAWSRHPCTSIKHADQPPACILVPKSGTNHRTPLPCPKLTSAPTFVHRVCFASN